MRKHAGPPAGLVDEIYAAAEDPSNWSRVLRRVTSAVGATASAMVFEDLLCHTASVAEMVGFDDPTWVDRYRTYYAAHNPWMERGTRNGLFMSGNVITSQQVMPDAELLRTEYYADFLRGLDLHHLTGAVLLREPDTLSHLSILRPRRDGPFDDGDVRLLEDLAPHLRRAFRIHQKMAHIAAEREAISDALDRVPVGVLVFGAGREPLRVNRVAAELCASQDGLSLGKNGLAADSSAENERLRRALALARGVPGQPRSGSAMVVSRRSGRRPFSVMVSPLSGAARFGPDGATVVVFVTDPERCVDAGSLWSRLYCLTPAETALAGRLADGWDLAAAADALRITIGTARVHLKHLFAKTETHRQSELVRTLLLSGPSFERV